eukprot:12917923-Alexandrium_andersonii.AAC.1
MSACEVMGTRVVVLQKCKRTGEWLPTGFFSPEGKTAKAKALANRPICLILQGGHYRGAIPEQKQVQAMYRHQSKLKGKPSVFVRAAGVVGGSPGASEISRLLSLSPQRVPIGYPLGRRRARVQSLV